MTSINVIFYSKNRAMQLEACMRSLRNHFKEYDLAHKTVIFAATDKSYVTGYKKLIEDYPEVSFVPESNFKAQTVAAIHPSNLHTMFVMDDILFKNDFSLGDNTFKAMNSYGTYVLAVSLRLHKGITYCYAIDKSTQLPAFIRDVPNEFCLWSWPGKQGDFGYAYSLDANLFFTDHIRNAILNIDFSNPNTLEANLNTKFGQGVVPHYMICYGDKAKMINVPANRVQNTFQNRHEQSYSEKDLNDRFLAGERISLNNVTNIDNNAVHYPLAFEFFKV